MLYNSNSQDGKNWIADRLQQYIFGTRCDLMNNGINVCVPGCAMSELLLFEEV